MYGKCITETSGISMYKIYRLEKPSNSYHNNYVSVYKLNGNQCFRNTHNVDFTDGLYFKHRFKMLKLNDLPPLIRVLYAAS